MSTRKSIFVGLTVVVLASAIFAVAKATTDLEKEIDTLIQKLGQRDWQDAEGMLAEIGALAVKPLIRTLKDESVKPWIIHARAVNILAKIGTPEAVEVIIETVKNEKLHQYVRAAAVKSLQQINAENAAGALVKAFNDESWLVRLNTREALLELGEPVCDILIKALSDSNSHVRWQAAWVLGRAKKVEAIDPLIESLADPDWMVRDEAAVALVRIGSEKVANRLDAMVKDQMDEFCRQIDWILAALKSGKTVVEEKDPHDGLEKRPPGKIHCEGKVYPCYPEMLEGRPDILSPYTTPNGTEVVTAFMKDGKFTLIPVTVENGKTLDYKQNLWGKGRQLTVDAADFPVLARTGLHSEAELDQTKMITGRSIVEIVEIGRPGRSSGAGFMSHDEDILSVLKGDNQLVGKMGLKHPQLARPLFHVWNMILRDHELGRFGRFWDKVEYILYHGQKVFVEGEAMKGWQESLFDDEILGRFEIDIWRELDQDDKAFLRGKYSHLTEQQMTELFKKLSTIHTGEMLPYYIMRYGFYEGHTDYRADPIAIVWIFGLKSVRQIDAAFDGKLYEALTKHFTKEDGRH